MSITKKIKPSLGFILALACISLAVLSVYSNTLNNEFLWDDEFLIQKNRYITDLSYTGEIFTSSSTEGFGGSDSFYRPMQIFFYTIIHSIAGQSPKAFHLGNILIHLLNALLLFLIIQWVFNQRLLAFVTALLWSLHPAHTEAITYMSGTADPLSLFFILLSLTCYLMAKRTDKAPWLSLVPALISFILALLSKESIIIFPGLLMSIDALKTEKRFKLATYKWTLPFWVISFSYLALRKTWLNFDESFEFYKIANIYTENIHYRLFTFLAALIDYFKIFFFPINLHMERSFPVFTNWNSPQVLFSASLLLGSGLFIWVQRKKDFPLFSFCFFWFFISFFPMSGILIPVNSFLLEHWLYLPSIALSILVAAALVKVHDLNKVTSIFSYFAIFIIAIALGASTYSRNKDWKDPITFYSNILSYNEGTARVHNNIAMAYATKEDNRNAIKHYLKAIEISDTYSQTHYNLARVYIRAEQYKKAQEHLSKSLKINPNFKWSIELQQKLNDFLKKNSSF